MKRTEAEIIHSLYPVGSDFFSYLSELSAMTFGATAVSLRRLIAVGVAFIEGPYKGNGYCNQELIDKCVNRPREAMRAGVIHSQEGSILLTQGGLSKVQAEVEQVKASIRADHSACMALSRIDHSFLPGAITTLTRALAKREHILDNRDAYEYYRDVDTKTRTYVLCFVGSPEHRHHLEKTFRQDLYDRDLANANAEISSAKQAIQSQICSLKSQFSSLQQQELATQQAATQARYQAQIYAMQQQKIAIQKAQEAKQQELIKQQELAREAEVKKLQQGISLLCNQTETFHTEINDKTSAASKLTVEKQADIQEDQKKLAQITAEDRRLEVEVTQQERENIDFVKSMNPKERADMLSEFIDQPSAYGILSAIKSLGFDATCLAYIAIKKGHGGLLDIALGQSADCTATEIEGATILQHAVRAKLDGFVLKILDSDNVDIWATLSLAIVQDDVDTVAALFGHDINLSYQKIHGFTILQYAIACDRIDIVQKILDINPSTIGVLTNAGESAFKIAIRSANQEIVKLVAPYSNVLDEAKGFIEREETVLLTKLLESKIIKDPTLHELLLYALNHNSVNAIKTLAEHDLHIGDNIQGIYDKATRHTDTFLMQSVSKHFKLTDGAWQIVDQPGKFEEPAEVYDFSKILHSITTDFVDEIETFAHTLLIGQVSQEPALLPT